MLCERTSCRTLLSSSRSRSRSPSAFGAYSKFIGLYGRLFDWFVFLTPFITSECSFCLRSCAWSCRCSSCSHRRLSRSRFQSLFFSIISLCRSFSQWRLTCSEEAKSLLNRSSESMQCSLATGPFPSPQIMLAAPVPTGENFTAVHSHVPVVGAVLHRNQALVTIQYATIIQCSQRQLSDAEWHLPFQRLGMYQCKINLSLEPSQGVHSSQQNIDQAPSTGSHLQAEPQGRRSHFQQSSLPINQGQFGQSQQRERKRLSKFEGGLQKFWKGRSQMRINMQGYLAFFIGVTALSFQIGVLYPWHKEINEEVIELEKSVKHLTRIIGQLKKVK